MMSDNEHWSLLKWRPIASIIIEIIIFNRGFNQLTQLGTSAVLQLLIYSSLYHEYIYVVQLLLQRERASRRGLTKNVFLRNFLNTLLSRPDRSYYSYYWVWWDIARGCVEWRRHACSLTNCRPWFKIRPYH